MNKQLFNKLLERKPEQCQSEWQIFLEICEMYLRDMQVKNPIVVELGIYNNLQKPFWEQLFGARHIGIDLSSRHGKPEIYGSTHDLGTFNTLKKMLEGQAINILFIDANHRYNDVKQDFEMYAPLCNGIIVFHDTELRKAEVGKYWNELKEKALKGDEELKNFLFLSIYQYRKSRIQMGIGMMVRR